MAEFTFGKWALMPRKEANEYYDNKEHDDFIVITHRCGPTSGSCFCACGLCLNGLKNGKISIAGLCERCMDCKELVPDEVMALFILRNNLI